MTLPIFLDIHITGGFDISLEITWTDPSDKGSQQYTVPSYLPTTFQKRNGWMDDLRFYVLFNSISVISGRCLDDNERLCAMELRLRMRRFHLE